MKKLYFSASEAIKEGWETFKANPFYYIGIFFLIFLIEAGLSGFSANKSALLSLINFIVSPVLALFLTGFSLFAVRKKGNFDFNEVITSSVNLSKFINLLAYSIAVGIFVGGIVMFLMLSVFSMNLSENIELNQPVSTFSIILTLILIVLIVWIFIRLMFVTYFIVDEGENFIDAVTHS